MELYHGTDHEPFTKFRGAFTFITEDISFARMYGRNIAVIDSEENIGFFDPIAGHPEESPTYFSGCPTLLKIKEWRK